MREDATFSEEKLTQEQFSEKYWMGGEFPYQYHTGAIEDGRDEREQFIFNNIRALKEMIDWHVKYALAARESSQRKIKKITALATTSTVIGAVGLVAAIIAYLK